MYCDTEKYTYVMCFAQKQREYSLVKLKLFLENYGFYLGLKFVGGRQTHEPKERHVK